MAVEHQAKKSKATSRPDTTSFEVGEPTISTDDVPAKKHKKNKKTDHSQDAGTSVTTNNVPSAGEPKQKKRKHDKPPQAAEQGVSAGVAEGGDAIQITPDASKKKKRKRDATADTIGQGDTPTEDSRKRKKRKGDTQNDAPAEPNAEVDQTDADEVKPKKKYPHPSKDESLSEQASKALAYAYTYHKHHDVWKFNKAHQNWLIRHCWSTTEIPDDYIPLLKKYLKNLQGGARERLLESCRAIFEAAEAPEAQDEADNVEEQVENNTPTDGSPSKSVRFAETTEKKDMKKKEDTSALKKDTRPPESKVKRAKAFAKVLSS
ncbi:hypothetical protein HDZ31DRAFT_82718 [Schizophyllum fasciatum]